MEYRKIVYLRIMVLINLTDDQSIELKHIENLGLIALTTTQWGNESTTVYLTKEEEVYVAEFMLNYIDSVS